MRLLTFYIHFFPTNVQRKIWFQRKITTKFVILTSTESRVRDFFRLWPKACCALWKIRNLIDSLVDCRLFRGFLMSGTPDQTIWRTAVWSFSRQTLYDSPTDRGLWDLGLSDDLAEWNYWMKIRHQQGDFIVGKSKVGCLSSISNLFLSFSLRPPHFYLGTWLSVRIPPSNMAWKEWK